MEYNSPRLHNDSFPCPLSMKKKIEKNTAKILQKQLPVPEEACLAWCLAASSNLVSKTTKLFVYKANGAFFFPFFFFLPLSLF